MPGRSAPRLPAVMTVEATVVAWRSPPVGPQSPVLM